MSRFLFEIEKNERETLGFELVSYKGREIINMRVWYRDRDGELKPSRKGLTFSSELLDQVEEGLRVVGQALNMSKSRNVLTSDRRDAVP